MFHIAAFLRDDRFAIILAQEKNLVEILRQCFSEKRETTDPLKGNSRKSQLLSGRLRDDFLVENGYKKDAGLKSRRLSYVSNRDLRDVYICRAVSCAGNLKNCQVYMKCCTLRTWLKLHIIFL